MRIPTTRTAIALTTTLLTAGGVLAAPAIAGGQRTDMPVTRYQAQVIESAPTQPAADREPARRATHGAMPVSWHQRAVLQSNDVAAHNETAGSAS